jgi:flagellar basal-body rod protein FlgG
VAIEGTAFFKCSGPTAPSPTPAPGSFIEQPGHHRHHRRRPIIPTITVPASATAVTITQYGVVNATLPGQQNPSQLGQIQLATFPNPGGLESMGSNLLATRSAPAIRSPAIPAAPKGLGTLQQGYLENSNVDVVTRCLCRWCWRSEPTNRTPR